MRLAAVLSRRGLLRSAVASAAAVAVQACGGLSGAAGDAARLADLIAEVEGREAIGRAYLGNDAANSPSEHASAIYRDLGWFSRSASTEELRRRIGALVVDDFQHGRVVTVEGWRLSVTEARLCAISELMPAPADGVSPAKP